MSTLLSLVVVYFLQRQLGNYAFLKKLQHSCSAAWLDDLLFKAQMLSNNFNKIPIIGSCALLIAAVSVVVVVLQLIFYYASGSIGAFLFNIAILFYCLSSATKKQYFSVFVTAFEHNFSLLFWFVVLGPVGTVLYWLFIIGGVKYTPVNVVVENNIKVDNKEEVVLKINPANELYYAKNIGNCLYILHTIAAWLPARITGLIFTLVGDFERGFAKWKNIIRILHMPHTEVLDVCGDASLGNLTSEQSQLLVERAFVAWIIFCMIIALIF